MHNIHNIFLSHPHLLISDHEQMLLILLKEINLKEVGMRWDYQ